jgi:hypothetical protein
LDEKIVKITVSGRITQGNDGVYRFSVTIGKGPTARVMHLDLDARYQADSPEPTRPFGEEYSLWMACGLIVE